MLIQKKLTLPRVEYYTTHLRLINAVLPVKMSDREIDIVASFMALDGDIADDRFGTTGRKLVRTRLGLSHQNLSNFLKSLYKKGILINGGGTHPILKVNPNEQEYRFFISQI